MSKKAKKAKTNIKLKMKPTALTVTTTPWGSYKYIYVDLAAGIVIKKLIIKEGHRFSLQKHLNRTEYWHVLKNTKFIITIQDFPTSCIVTQSDLTPIKVNPNKLHRAEALVGDLEIIETSIFYHKSYSSLEHFESDIERYHDDYGRT